MFAVVVGAPILLPALGARLTDFVFLVPLLACAFAAIRCTTAYGSARGHRSVWVAFGSATALAAAASAVGLASTLLGSSATAAFYFGSLASVCLIIGAASLGLRALARARFDHMADALIFGALISAMSVYFVVVPGVQHGDTLLTAVFLVDVAAVLLAVTAGVAGATSEQRLIAWGVAAACGAAAVGDGLVSASAAGQIGDQTVLAALLWTIGAVLIATAADQETGGLGVTATAPQAERWLTARVLLPFAAVLAVPATAFGIWLAGSLTPWAAGFFASFFAGILLLVFIRQAYLLVDNRRSIVRERTLSDAMGRRNQDLEALTGLASTMTQTLEETPIMERGLETMRLAARASSAALRLGEGDLTAVAGRWQDEHAWATGIASSDGRAHVKTRGGRHIFLFPLSARGNEIGTVTLMRRADDDYDREEVERLELLANQLAIAIQNARDYREKLEQAIRDPLTGVYNRRFFFEALEKEVARRERYGSPVSLVIFDIDDFKSINDTFGHAVGDDALRKVTQIAGQLVRPIDSFARLGGEEFGLLLPETQQLDALLVADRLRAAIARQEVIPGRRVTLSGGVASCPQDAMTAEDLEQSADAALYWAKRNGKNICAVASEVTTDAGGNELEASLSHLYALVSTIDAEPLHTRDHSENVAAYAVALGQELGLSEERVVALRRAAFFHDIGKIAVPRSTLTKPGALDDAEWDQIRIHPGVGSTMLEHAGLSEEARWVAQHHERVDGRGYPNGCSGGEIDLEARIIFVADAFEAMTSDRPYRKGIEVDAALAELRECAGSQFDSKVVDAMVALLDRDALTVLALRAA